MAVYACSDMHGCLHFYNEIKKMLKPEDQVFFLGDAGDRGPHPWECIKAILNDPQWVYIKGNHELMLIDCLEDYRDDGYPSYHSVSLLSRNGGDQTFEEAIQDPEWLKVLGQLKRLPNHAEYQNANGERVLLSHAGFTPWITEGNQLRWPIERDLVWDREHFFDGWPDDEICDNMVIVHGHTPTIYLADHYLPWQFKDVEVEPGAIWYEGNRKVDIDSGAFFSGYFTLLDLDTWDEHVFETEIAEDN